MQHFSEGAAAARAVVGTGVVFLVFRLVGDAVNDHVIHLDIAIARVICESDAQFTSGVGVNGVIAHEGAQRPSLDGAAAHFEAHTLIAYDTTHAYGDGVVTCATAG